MCEWQVNVQVPNGYSANLSRCLNILEHKISGMKTHDCHVFLERLLSLTMWEVLLPKQNCDALIEVSTFFRESCAKVLKEEDLVRLEKQISLTLCKLEKIFPIFILQIKNGNLLWLCTVHAALFFYHVGFVTIINLTVSAICVCLKYFCWMFNWLLMMLYSLKFL